MSLGAVYIAGPMSGLPDLNHPAFHSAAAELRAAGYEVLNPAENTGPDADDWAGWMRLAIAQLVRSQAVVLLPGWERSRGARLEHFLARELGLICAGPQDFLTAARRLRAHPQPEKEPA